MSKYRSIHKLLTLREADEDRMPEQDISSSDPIDDAPPVDDMSFDDPMLDAEPEQDEVVDIPNVTLSNTDKAVLSLLVLRAQAPAAAKTSIDGNPNAAESLRGLLAVGAVRADVDGYHLEDVGERLMRAHGLYADDTGEDLSKEASLNVVTTFY